MDSFIAPELPGIQREAQDTALGDKFMAWFEEQAPAVQEFILAMIEEDETGVMPMPPAPPMPLMPPAPML